jgi:hypothetical protein
VITPAEVEALTQLLNRAPLTLAEAQWATGFVGRLRELAEAAGAGAGPSPGEPPRTEERAPGDSPAG